MSTDEWRERLERAVAETLRHRAARRDLRRDLDAARQVGLTARHARKLARNRQGDTVSEAPACCREADEEQCPQHAQAAQVLRHSGIRLHGGRVSVVVGESGKARPAEPEEPS